MTAMSAAVGIEIGGTGGICTGSGVEVVISIGIGMGGGPRDDMSGGARDLGVRKIVEIGIETVGTAIEGEARKCIQVMPQIFSAPRPYQLARND